MMAIPAVRDRLGLRVQPPPQRHAVNVMDTVLAAQAIECLAQLRRKQLRKPAPHRALARNAGSFSICEFQLSTRSSRAAARIPTLMDSTMFSLNSFSRSYSSTLRCREL